jgi:acyl-CoA thioesterase-1
MCGTSGGRVASWRIAVVSVLAFLMGLLPTFATPASAATAVRIMPIGDSITEGFDGDITYRWFLWHDLVDGGHSVDFVGAKTGVYSGAPRYTDFDQNHQGVAGRRADQIAKIIYDRAVKKRPDIALVHLGTNDLNQGQSDASTKTDLVKIISELRRANPNITVLLAQLINRNGREAATATLNDVIATIPGEVSTAASPVLLVDQYTGFDPRVGFDTYDGVHPSDSGYEKMANRWFGVLDSVLGGGTSTAPTITSQPSDVTAQEGDPAIFSVSATGTPPLTYQWRRGGVDISGATGSSYTLPAATTSDNGATFDVVVTNGVSSVTSTTATLTVVPPTTSDRVTAGILALYEFAEGAGSAVNDTSGVGVPLPLTINDMTRTSWLPGGGLSVNDATSITSSVAATKIISGVVSSGEITAEAWIRPANLTQYGPAAIAGITRSFSNRNLAVGQVTFGGSPTVVDARFRTTSTDLKGLPSTTSGGVLDGTLQHIVYTRSADGTTTIYVDGVNAMTSSVSGDASVWDVAARVILANEFGNTPRPWLGELHLVAFYARALTAGEVAQNHAAGV